MPHNRLEHVFIELRNHSPFTMGGAILGMIFMFLFHRMGHAAATVFFLVAHPAHVVLSAIVTAAMIKTRGKIRNFFTIIVIGWLASVGIATVSDIIIPYFGTEWFGLAVPTEAGVHHIMHREDSEHETTVEDHPAEHGGLHLAFIEHWYLVNPAALLGIIIAWFWPHTKTPHAAHILISTAASGLYMLMVSDFVFSPLTCLAIVIILFVAVWLPCCISDIIVPMLVVGGQCCEDGYEEKSGIKKHSREHE